MVTLRRPLYSGSGFRLYNGAGLALSEEFQSDSLEQAIFDLLTEVRAVIGGPGSTVSQMLGASIQQQQQISTYAQGAMLFGAVASLVAPEVGVPLTLGGAVIDFLNTQDFGGEVQLPADMPASNMDRLVSGDAPVTPITPPPAGYGGGSAGDVAEAVWTYPAYLWSALLGRYVGQALGAVQQAGESAAILAAHQGAVDSRNPYFALVAPNGALASGLSFITWGGGVALSVPALDFSAVLADDTVLSFLQREVPSFDWDNEGPFGTATPGGVWAPLGESYPNLYWRCLLTDQTLQLLRVRQVAESAGAPAWPGEDFATLGTPVEFDGPAEITAPMHGVLVDYTTLPQKVDMWQVSTFQNFGHAGQLAFVSDNGYAEPWQYLQWGKQVYVPRALSVAASVLIRPIAGQEGTVTPWTID